MPKKRKRAAPVPKKRAPAKKRVTQKQKRSKAASKGWATRRKKQRLLEAMADHKLARESEDQPLGWIERREQLRMNNGELWRKISVTYDQSIVDKRRLETLQELEIDLATRDELHDYLEWVADMDDLDLSDVYRMYLGYGLQADE